VVKTALKKTGKKKFYFFFIEQIVILPTFLTVGQESPPFISR
jgi:hypothetical protein